MAKKIRNLLLLGAAVGAAAAGTYYYLQKKDADYFDEDDDEEDFDLFEDEDELDSRDSKSSRNYVPLHSLGLPIAAKKRLLKQTRLQRKLPQSKMLHWKAWIP